MNAINLIRYLSDMFGSEWVSCEEPESIELCLATDVDISDDMIGAIKTCILSELPWEDPFVFENVVDGINGNEIIPETLSMPPLEEIASAVFVMNVIKPNNEFSHDVKKYICACAMSCGLVWLPEPLLFAADFMADTGSGLQFMVKKSIEVSGWPVYDYPYTDDHVDIQLQRLAAIDYAYRLMIN
ncbi:MAG: hypothetical protein Q8M92_03605 [Candidatus Subteraquimicrobiales bacterium]|nr:hypothetical protein [Candidatus Subteraquimicrobiales bacterium]